MYQDRAKFDPNKFPVICNVWETNLENAIKAITDISDKFNFVAMVI